MSRTTNRESQTREALESPPDDQLAQLRRLLLGEEKQRLDEIQRRLDDPEISARDVARVLAEAHRIRSRQDDDLGAALGPTISEAFDVSIKKDPVKLANAIAPILGPAIRASITQAIRTMTQSLNRTFEQSLSLQGLKWRLEARRTGKPFGEIVLMNTLVYQVEQVFLIHPDSGLVMQHVARETAAVKDADTVSGMLTAIQDFVRDSFGGDAIDTLHTMHVGERTVWVEQGPHAALATVIRGIPPEKLRSTVKKTLERVHLENREQLLTFDGDASGLESTSYELEQCLEERFRRDNDQDQSRDDGGEKSSSKKKRVLLAVAGALILALVVYLAVNGWRTTARRRESIQRWDNFVRKLADQPGIVVTRSEVDGDRFLVAGLRDPQATNPKSLLKTTGIDADKVVFRWKPYQSLEPQFVLARIERILQPPRGIELKLVDGVLVISGWAPESWIRDARRIAPAIGGVDYVDTSRVVSSGM